MDVAIQAIYVSSIDAIVMVTTDIDFVFIWQVTKPVEEIKSFLLSADHTEISRVYHHIGLGQIPKPMVAAVSVREVEYFHRL